MKSRIHTVIAFVFFVAATPAAAGDSSSKAQAQQERFSHCSHESKAMKGEERHKFMNECLKDARGGQQHKMKTCNVEAGKKDLHGDERRAFMSSCLKG